MAKVSANRRISSYFNGFRRLSTFIHSAYHLGKAIESRFSPPFTSPRRSGRHRHLRHRDVRKRITPTCTGPTLTVRKQHQSRRSRFISARSRVATPFPDCARTDAEQTAQPILSRATQSWMAPGKEALHRCIPATKLNSLAGLSDTEMGR